MDRDPSSKPSQSVALTGACEETRDRNGCGLRERFNTVTIDNEQPVRLRQHFIKDLQRLHRKLELRRHRWDHPQQCCDLPGIGTAEEPVSTEAVAEDEPVPTTIECPHCGGCMTGIEARQHPSWSITMHGAHRPRWYLDD